MSNDSELVAFVRSYREPVKLTEAASELHALGSNGADWPRASQEHWIRELEQLVKAGELAEENGFVSIKRREEITQLNLFEGL
jgi:hypothetical protein